jgi:hypothetical protein
VQFFLYFQSVHNQSFVIKNHIYRCHHRALLDGTCAPGCCCSNDVVACERPDSSAVRQRVRWNWKGVPSVRTFGHPRVQRSNRARESEAAETGGVGLIRKVWSGEGNGWFVVALRDAARRSSAHRLTGGANLRWLLKLKYMWLTFATVVAADSCDPIRREDFALACWMLLRMLCACYSLSRCSRRSTSHAAACLRLLLCCWSICCNIPLKQSETFKTYARNIYVATATYAASR